MLFLLNKILRGESENGKKMQPYIRGYISESILCIAKSSTPPVISNDWQLLFILLWRLKHADHADNIKASFSSVLFASWLYKGLQVFASVWNTICLDSHKLNQCGTSLQACEQVRTCYLCWRAQLLWNNWKMAFYICNTQLCCHWHPSLSSFSVYPSLPYSH